MAQQNVLIGGRTVTTADIAHMIAGEVPDLDLNGQDWELQDDPEVDGEQITLTFVTDPSAQIVTVVLRVESVTVR